MYFFIDDKLHFFKHLSGINRELTVACLSAVYLRLNGPDADYSYHLTKEDVLDIFFTAIQGVPIFSEEEDHNTYDEKKLSASELKEKAADLFLKLRRTGWFEEYRDPGASRSAYRLSVDGRSFASNFTKDSEEIFLESQNTLNTLSNLKQFTAGVESNQFLIDYLMTATYYSNEIMADFNNTLQKISDYRRELVSSVNKQMSDANSAGDNFFQVIKQQVIPDIQSRFDKDSISKYKPELILLIQTIRDYPTKTKFEIEKALRVKYGYLLKEDRPSILLWSLDRIEQRVTQACDTKSPELRTKVSDFVRHAHLLLNQIANLESENNEQSIFYLLKKIKTLNSTKREMLFESDSTGFPLQSLSLVNPGDISHKKSVKRVQNKDAVNLSPEITKESKKKIQIRKAISEAFRVESNLISEYIIDQLAGGHSIEGKRLIIYSPETLIGALFDTELGGINTPLSKNFEVKAIPGEINNQYYQGQIFEIRYIQ